MLAQQRSSTMSGAQVKLLTAHTQRVQRLYRASLKNLLNWCVHRDLWIKKGFELRAEFDANKSVKDARLIEKLVSDGEAKLQEFQHPDPYTCERMRRLTPPRPRSAPRISAPAPPALHPPPLFSLCVRVSVSVRKSLLVPLTAATIARRPQCRTCPAAPNTCVTRTTAWGLPQRSSASPTTSSSAPGGRPLTVTQQTGMAPPCARALSSSALPPAHSMDVEASG